MEAQALKVQKFCQKFEANLAKPDVFARVDAGQKLDAEQAWPELFGRKSLAQPIYHEVA